jgi:hypothetical protein
MTLIVMRPRPSSRPFSSILAGSGATAQPVSKQARTAQVINLKIMRCFIQQRKHVVKKFILPPTGRAKYQNQPPMHYDAKDTEGSRSRVEKGDQACPCKSIRKKWDASIFNLLPIHQRVA